MAVRGTVAGLLMVAGLGTTALSPTSTFAAEARTARIRYYEPFNVLATGAAGGSQKANTGTVRKAHFNAYGRRFDLSLEKNAKLAAALPPADASGPTLSLYRGVIENIPGSWVRLSAKGQTVRGMIWDGRDLYIAELADTVRDSLDTALPAPSGETVIFKLADAEIDKEAAFCATTNDASSRNGIDAYKSLVTELKGSPVIQRAAGAGERLELSVYADAHFLARGASEQEARDEVLLRLNNVDGIFTSQLGVELQVPTMTVATPETESLSDTTVPSTLLSEVRMLRRQTPEMYARGLTHVFTGRNLDGNTVGIAYQDVLCSRDWGAGLTEASGRGSWIESLIAAHEIGHNFGAFHDGDPDGDAGHPADPALCALTPTGQFVMSPSVSPNASTFSECSLRIMRQEAQRASCIVVMPPADMSVPFDMGTVHKTVSTQFTWDLTVSNMGGAVAMDSRIDLVVPPTVQVDDVWVAGGTCTSAAGAISCLLGDVPGSATRVIHLTLHSDVVGTNSVSAHVSAQNDAQAANDAGNGTLVIEAVATTPTPQPTLPTTNSQQASGGGGGGGATNPLWLAALACLFWFRLKKRRG
jgi:hypothetical protein